MLLWWLATTHPQFNEDSAQYLANARNLSAHPLRDYTANRPPGYPLFLVLTGVTWLDTFRGLVAAQALMGLAIPVLVWLTLLPVGRAPALAAGLATAAVPIPYAYAGMVMTDQLNMFLQFLFVFFAARSLTGRRPPLFLHLAALTAFLMVLTRAAAGLTFWVFLPVAVLAPPRRLKQPLLAAGLYCFLLVAWSAGDWLLLGHGGRLPPSVLLSADLAEQRFAETYFSTWSRNFRDYEHPRPLITPEAGPASRALYDRLAHVLRGEPKLWAALSIFLPPQARFGAPGADPEALLREIFLRPSPQYFNFMQAALSAELGAQAAGDLFAAIPREYGQTGLRGLLAHLSLGVPTRLAGTSLFWEAYAAGRHHGAYDPDHPQRLIRPENGPATRQLYEAVAAFGSSTARFGGDAARAILDDPEAGAYPLIWKATLELYGSAASDRLLRDVALEAFRAYPKSALLFWDNFLMLAAGPNDVRYGRAVRTTDLAGVIFLSSGTEALPEPMRAEVGGGKPATPFFDALYRLAHLLKPAVLIACLVFFRFGWAGPARPLLCLLLLLALSQYAVVSVMAQAHQRYADPVYPLLVMAAALCVHQARCGGGLRAASPPPCPRTAPPP
jgi:hypothetical protein